MRYILLFLFISGVPMIPFGQDELTLLKIIYRTSDALKKSGRISVTDTVAVFKRAKKVDKRHPVGFFKYVTNFSKKAEFNEAALMYYIGIMRFSYFNSANPEYQASGDGALLGALQYSVGEPLNAYLRTDIDNFMNILKLTVNYSEQNDFKFFSKSKDIEKYNKQIQTHKELIIELDTNREKHIKQWAKERNSMENKINELSQKAKRKGNK